MVEFDIHAQATDLDYVTKLEAARSKAVYSILADAKELDDSLPLEAMHITQGERCMAWQQYAYEFSNDSAEILKTELGTDARIAQPGFGNIAKKLGGLTIDFVKEEIDERYDSYSEILPNIIPEHTALPEENKQRLLQNVHESWQMLQLTGNQHSIASLGRIVSESLYVSTLRRLTQEHQIILGLSEVPEQELTKAS